MGTPNFFGVTTVKQETEDGSSDGDKDVFGSKHPIFSVEHEANFCAISAGISKDCTANSNHLQQEFTTDGDKGSYENDVSEEGCGIPCMPDLISTCLKQEMKVDCQDNELPSNIYVITENDMVKQEICRTGETSFENAAYEEALLLSSHLGDHQRNPSGGNPFDCVTCTSSSNLSEHHISHKEEKLFKCDICKKKFRQKTQLSNHQRTHTGEQPFQCNICEKRFTSNLSLYQHQGTHTGEKPFKCDICEKVFRHITHLSNHQRTHTGEKPFKCDICKKNFRQKATLSNHQRTHTKEKPFKCDICEKHFTLSSSLSKHQRTHSGERPFECDICEKNFSHKTSLSNHQRIHTGEKPFKCHICGKRFTSSSTLYYHQRTYSGCMRKNISPKT
ncbi:zinc finger protein 501-like isoform X4 [Artemia franciscana]|uniref:zinc finger protein 501-like isoform X3 n=1 Tax=Artemia franciscana TaxID=6661 RepID=UPI0032DAC374